MRFSRNLLYHNVSHIVLYLVQHGLNNAAYGEQKSKRFDLNGDKIRPIVRPHRGKAHRLTFQFPVAGEARAILTAERQTSARHRSFAHSHAAARWKSASAERRAARSGRVAGERCSIFIGEPFTLSPAQSAAATTTADESEQRDLPASMSACGKRMAKPREAGLPSPVAKKPRPAPAGTDRWTDGFQSGPSFVRTSFPRMLCADPLAPKLLTAARGQQARRSRGKSRARRRGAASPTTARRRTSRTRSRTPGASLELTTTSKFHVDV